MVDYRPDDPIWTTPEKKKKVVKKAYIPPKKETVVVPPVVDAPIVDPNAPPVVESNVIDPTKPFAYDPTKDMGYQAAVEETNRKIANAMNRRGIYGSTIMQENLNTADTQLIDTYAQMAQDKYNKAVSDRQNKMEMAYSNAKKRGYYNNEEAALWGVPPGTRIASGSSGGPSGSAATTGNDGTKYDKNGAIIYSTPQKANKTELMNSYEDNPRVAIWNIVNNTTLTQAQKDEIIDSITGAQQYYEEYLRMLSEGHKFPNAQQYYNYIRTNPNSPSFGGTGYTKGNFNNRTEQELEEVATDRAPTTDPSKYETDKQTWRELEDYWKSRGY